MFSNDYSKAATTMSLSILVGKFLNPVTMGIRCPYHRRHSHRNAQRLQLVERERISARYAPLA